jgi:hypothetical protein
MGTYIIIGGDGKEYGPITEADVRQWIAEGRLNARSLAKSVSDAEFRPLDKFPELGNLWIGGSPANISQLPSSYEISGDYEIDLGGCISQGWELTKKNFGILFATILVFIGIRIALSSMISFAVVAPLTKMFPSPVISVALGFLMVALNAPIMGPLLGGVFLVFLKTIRGESAAVGQVFAGFQKNLAQLFLGSLVVNLILVLCMSPASYVIAAKINPLLLQLQSMQAQSSAPAEMGKVFSQMLSAYASALPILLVCMVPVTYLSVCWQFTLALVIDKQLSFSAAMKTCWQRVNQHWWQVFGLTILATVVLAGGLLGCGIGILFTIPIACAAMMLAYETIFSAKKN